MAETHDLTPAEPDTEAQHQTALVPQHQQLALTASVADVPAPQILDPENKINSGQVRSGLERRQARHSAFRPFER